MAVPWRGGDELREQSWDITRPYLAALGYPIRTGDSKGPWARAAAANAACAGTWDVAVLADADTIPEAAAIEAAIKRARKTGGVVRPHDHLIRLTPSGSIAFAKNGPTAILPRHIETEHPGGGLLVIARRAWDAVGGFDTNFVGWGHEDSAFNIAVIAAGCAWERIPGRAWHLWHPGPARANRQYRDNRKRLTLLRREHAAALRAASEAAGMKLEAIL